MTRKLLIALTAIALVALLAVSVAYAATLDIQTVTNKYKYAQGTTVVVRADAKNGSTRITSSKISSATVTIKNPSGQTVVNAASMSKDSYTGLCYYNYTLSTSAPKGTWTATVTIRDTSSNSGTGTTTFKVQVPVPDHTALIDQAGGYTGTATCIGCHSQQANDMFASVHYQWTGDNQKAIELAAAGSNASKMGGINNFCIWPDANWLTIFNKLDGTKAPSGGCAWCHAGRGLKPSPTVSQAQLENIDCLICHSATYKRVVVQNVDGTFSMAPDPTIDIQAAAKGISRPTKAMCMRCHNKSGGGDNYKRGDLESNISNCTKANDVHMGTDGQNFECQDCHRTDNHRMAGRGSDMRALDSPVSMACESCHTRLPHRSYNANYADLDRHTDRIFCTTCHVPSFAKTVATDMNRDWSQMEVDVNKQLYDPVMTKQTNVTPSYAWFDGFSHFYKFKDPVTPDSRGVQKISWPDGAFEDAAGKYSKLYPFKVHVGNSPKNNAAGNASDNVLLPVKNKIAFETGNVTNAITAGAAAAGITYNGHSFMTTEQYEGIFHTVGPKSTALSCSTNTVCHAQLGGTSNRIPFASLGYTRRGTTSQLCDVCHSLRSYSSFTSLHSNHRDRKNCTACHGTGYPLKEPTTTLCDNCHSRETFDNANSVHSRHVQSKGYDCSNCHTFSAGMTGGHSKDH